MTLCYTDGTFLASPSFVSLGSSSHPLKASNSTRCSLGSFHLFNKYLLGSTTCPKLCQTLREKVMSKTWSGAYVLVEETDIHFNSIAISTLKEKQTVLWEHLSRALMWSGGSGEASLRKWPCGLSLNTKSSLSNSRMAWLHNFHKVATSQRCLAISMKHIPGLNL